MKHYFTFTIGFFKIYIKLFELNIVDINFKLFNIKKLNLLNFYYFGFGWRIEFLNDLFHITNNKISGFNIYFNDKRIFK